MAAAITLDELVALNDEMLALVKAGVPLSQGLADVGHDVRGTLGRISQTLSDRVGRGEPLPQVLATSKQQFPPLYAALVEAGIRAGRLPAALEEMSASLRRLAALRRVVILAAIYPLIVFFVCYGLFLFFVIKIAPLLLSAAPMENPPTIVHAIAGIRDGIAWWGAILPTVVLTAAVLWLYRSRRALVVETGGAVRLFGWVPSFRRLLRESRTAGFADVLAMLVEQYVPLAEAVKLAGHASADSALAAAADRLSADLARGATAREADNSSPVPPLLQWLIATGARQPALAKALRDAADTYRRRAIRRADRLRVQLPIILTVGIGGTVTLLYALSLFAPWTSMLYELTKP